MRRSKTLDTTDIVYCLLAVILGPILTVLTSGSAHADPPIGQAAAHTFGFSADNVDTETSVYGPHSCRGYGQTK